MLAIKLKLIGKKGQHSFRVIVQEKKAKLQGQFVEDLGWYNPHSNQFKLDQTKLKYWLDNGAQPTETVARLINKSAADSEVQSYEGRKNPKKKKKDKKESSAGEVQPLVEGTSEASGDSSAVTEEVGAEDSPSTQQEEKEEMSESTEDKAVESDASSVAQEDGSPSTS